MASLPVSVRQFNPQTQQLLRDLNDRLPDRVFVHSQETSVSIRYPDDMKRDDVERTVRRLLAELDAGRAGINLD